MRYIVEINTDFMLHGSDRALSHTWASTTLQDITPCAESIAECPTPIILGAC